MKRRRRQPTRHEAIVRAISECSASLERAYKQPDVYVNDLRSILAVLLDLHISRGDDLRIQIGRTQ